MYKHVTLRIYGQIYPNMYLHIDYIEASLVAQWLGIHLPMQGALVRALVQEDPTCHGATKLCAKTTEPVL